MLFRFAVLITLLEAVLTAAASLIVTYTDPHPSFLTTDDLRELGLKYETHENRRSVHMNALYYDTRAKLSAPEATLYASLRTSSEATDFEFRRSREEVIRERSGRSDSVIISEPSPGERGFAVRRQSPASMRVELVRLRGTEMLIVRVEREAPFDAQASVELARCERRARAVQEHLMFKMRWRD